MKQANLMHIEPIEDINVHKKRLFFVLFSLLLIFDVNMKHLRYKYGKYACLKDSLATNLTLKTL